MTGFEALLTGRVLVDRYRIEEVIGRGGMGAVFRAKDERLGRDVAVKVITAMGAAGPEARERIRARFRHEAASAARLPHHPNVVPVYDYGTDPALELDFIVMELLRGEDLSSRLARSGPPPLPEALEILHQAARGLSVGHRAGVIHRDVKPGNVFLVHPEDPEELQVRILDFGIAKLVEDEDTFTQLTQDGRAPLSPAYASPEQLRGEERLTPASDVFSLGAVAFQLLTGEKPFTEADRNRMGIGLPVPVPALRARNPSVPPAVEAVVRRALAHDPAERFPHAGAFAAALAPVSGAPADAGPQIGIVPAAEEEDHTQLAEEDQTLLAPPEREPAPVPPPRPPRRREPEREGNRAFLWTLFVILLAGGGLFAWWAMEGGEREVERPLADLADSVLVDTLPEEVAPDPLDPVMQNLEGVRYMEAGDYAAALAHFQRAVQLDPDNPEYRNNLAEAFFRMGRLEEAALILRNLVRTHPDRAQAYSDLVDVELARGDTLAAVQALEEYVSRTRFDRAREVAEERLRELRPEVVAPEPPPIIDTVRGEALEEAPPRRAAPRDTIVLRPFAPRDTLVLPSGA